MYLFGISEYPLYRFAKKAVALLTCRGMAEVFCLLNVVFPNMLGYCLMMVPAFRASGKVRPRCANGRVACEDSVAFPISCAIWKTLIMRADNAIVVLIVDKFVGADHSLLSPRALVGHGRIAPIIDYLFADPHVLVRCILDQGFNFGEPLLRSAIEGSKSYAVVDVSGSNSNVQHKAPSVTGIVSRVRISSLVFSLMDHPTIRIRC